MLFMVLYPVALLFSGIAWVIAYRSMRWSFRSSRACMHCGYSLVGASGLNCPECGAAWNVPGVTSPSPSVQRRAVRNLLIVEMVAIGLAVMYALFLWQGRSIDSARGTWVHDVRFEMTAPMHEDQMWVLRATVPFDRMGFDHAFEYQDHGATELVFSLERSTTNPDPLHLARADTSSPWRTDSGTPASRKILEDWIESTGATFASSEERDLHVDALIIVVESEWSDPLMGAFRTRTEKAQSAWRRDRESPYPPMWMLRESRGTQLTQAWFLPAWFGRSIILCIAGGLAFFVLARFMSRNRMITEQPPASAVLSKLE